eukprot:6790492-Ditylum_brightwellii.AAC.1
MAMLWRSSRNRNTTTSSTNTEDNRKGLEEGACPVLGQESTSSISKTEGSQRSTLHCNNKTQETREIAAPGDPKVNAPDKTNDKTNKSVEQDTEVVDNSGGGELPD